MLNNFFKKVNKVTLDKTALQNEKERLLKENQDLRLILQVIRIELACLTIIY